MKFKKIISSLAIAGMMAIASANAITANASAIYEVTNSHSVYYEQNKNWCWVASAETSANHIATSSKTQADAVAYVKGSSDDTTGGDIDDIAYAANFFMSYSNGNANYVSYNGAKNFAFLKAQVMSNKEPIVGGWELLGSGNWNTHAVVVYKVVECDDGSKGIGYFDPADKSFHICAYNNFCNGQATGSYWQETCYAN